MTEFSIIVKQFLDGKLPTTFASTEFPDEHLGKIETTEDFLCFLTFIVENVKTDKVEYGCHDTYTFLCRMLELFDDEDVKTHTKASGIESDFGVLAYVILLAMGNE